MSSSTDRSSIQYLVVCFASDVVGIIEGRPLCGDMTIQW